MKRKVIGARLHALDVVIPGVGALTFTSLPTKSSLFKGMEMTWVGEGLLIEVAGSEVLVPAANVQAVILAPEDK